MYKESKYSKENERDLLMGSRTPPLKTRGKPIASVRPSPIRKIGMGLDVGWITVFPFAIAMRARLGCEFKTILV